jgi:hypothetical protein
MFYGKDREDYPHEKEIRTLWNKYWKLKGNKNEQKQILKQINELEIKQAEELNL